MKNATAPVQTTTNANVEGHKSQIDPEALGIVMEILSKMYSNGYRAVLREYSCNGFDSHVEAGQDRPVEVTLPTDLQPSLLIRDYGTGLTEEQILSVFGTYGRSTKRDTNDQVGAFGIGSKSAFVMTNQFIVTGYKDGVRTVVEFSLDDNNVATAYVQRVSKTREANGVLISIGVNEVNRMRAEAESFFSTWEPGNVLVDGEEPAKVWDKGYALSENIHVVPGHDGSVNIVMGQVAYPANRSVLEKVEVLLKGTKAEKQAEALLHWFSSATALYFKVGIGTVDIAPTREGLRDTDTTAKAVAALVEEMVEQVSASVKDAVKKAKSKYLAAIALEEALDNLGAFKVSRKTFPYRKEVLTKEVTVKDVKHVFATTQYGYRGGSKRVVGTEKEATLDIRRAQRTLVVVTNEDVSKVSRYAKRFLDEGEHFDRILVTDQPQGEEGWFQWGIGSLGAATWTLEEYRKALREMRDTNPRTKSEPSYTTGWNERASRDLDDRDLLSDIISWGKDIVVFYEQSNTSKFARAVLDDLFTPVVLLGTQSEAALIKRVTEDGSVQVHTDGWRDLVKAEAAKRLASYTDLERAAIGARTWLSEQRYEIKEIEGRLEALGGLEEVTHKGIKDDVDTIEIARLMADDIAQDRYDAVDELSPWTKNTEVEVPFEGSIEGFSRTRFPLIADIPSYRLARSADIKADALAYVNSKG